MSLTLLVASQFMLSYTVNAKKFLATLVLYRDLIECLWSVDLDSDPVDLDSSSVYLNSDLDLDPKDLDLEPEDSDLVDSTTSLQDSDVDKGIEV